MPTKTQGKLFPGMGLGTRSYLELCRFFVYDWCPKNTASRFLSFTHRLLRKHLNGLRFLFTYAAGFQGLIGYIYQATGYLYIGTQVVNSFLWIPSIGLVHNIALHHRYGDGNCNPARWQRIYPGAKRWCGHNFKYLLTTGSKKENEHLMACAAFKPQPYPKDNQLLIWTIDHHGKKEIIHPDAARKVPIVKLPTRRKHSGDALANQAREGSSKLTPALHTPGTS